MNVYLITNKVQGTYLYYRKPLNMFQFLYSNNKINIPKGRNDQTSLKVNTFFPLYNTFWCVGKGLFKKIGKLELTFIVLLGYCVCWFLKITFWSLKALCAAVSH